MATNGLEMKSSTYMINTPQAVRTALDDSSNKHLRGMLFPYGFLITKEEVATDTESFPFYGTWKRSVVHRFQILVHPDQALYSVDSDASVILLLGHAYDPISLISDESVILQAASEALINGQDEFLSVVNRLTGLFTLCVIMGDKITVYGDAAGMQTVFYGVVNDAPYVSSHASLIGALCGLKVQEYVTRLTSSRLYHLFGRSLPGDLSAYKEITQLVPNFSVTWNNGVFLITRFFWIEPARGSTLQDLEAIVGQSVEILKNSMMLAARKWNKPAISLTGGCDSQTILACANGNYDKFRYFSYVSSPEEQVDASAAADIARSIGIEHEVIIIPSDRSEIEDFNIIADICELNYGDIGRPRDSEVVKRIMLREADIEVEIKSWVSEIARCYYHKRFLKRRFPRHPGPRYLTTLYKVFMFDRKLVRDTDRIFEEYLGKYCVDGVFDRADWWDVVFWEFRVSSWNGSVISGEHRLSFEIDIPYNNRMLLQLMLGAQIGDRIDDVVHRRIRELANPDINRLGISVTNVKHTRNRARMERAYLEVHSRLPF